MKILVYILIVLCSQALWAKESCKDFTLSYTSNFKDFDTGQSKLIEDYLNAVTLRTQYQHFKITSPTIKASRAIMLVDLEEKFFVKKEDGLYIDVSRINFAKVSTLKIKIFNEGKSCEVSLAITDS